jgi:hypothetical protein
LKSEITSLPLARLLNEIDPGEIEKSLTVVIDNCITEDSVKDWRRWLIRYPQIWAAMSQRYIRFRDDHREIVLLKQKMLSAPSFEYESYALFIELKQECFTRLRYEEKGGYDIKYFSCQNEGKTCYITYRKVNEKYVWQISANIDFIEPDAKSFDSRESVIDALINGGYIVKTVDNIVKSSGSFN